MKLLLYCTKNKWRLFFDKVKQVFTLGKVKSNNDLNGKIVAECDYDVEEIFGISKGTNQPDKYDFKWEDSILNGACLTNDQMNDYMPHYAIHIKNLHIFDEPKELSEYGMDFPISPIVKAPQNMMYANGIGERYILISIQPQWLCKILNGDKTIEVRKKVLKEMLKNE